MYVRPGWQLSPLAAAGALAGHEGRFVLHSASDADGVGRYSFVGSNPTDVFCFRRGDVGEPFDAALALAGDMPAHPSGPVPLVVGYWGYELGSLIERLPARRSRDRSVPDAHFARYGAVYRYDRQRSEGTVLGPDSRAVEELCDSLHKAHLAPLLTPLEAEPFREQEAPELHMERIRRALDYIRAGDIYQVNLARCLRTPYQGDGLGLLPKMASRSAAPYGAFLEGDGFQVVANSPELFLRRGAHSQWVETRPIKGTRPRGQDTASDERLAVELACDEKEQAEHLMIVDLLRNDLGRVAVLGSVEVSGFKRNVPLPQVHHLVSTVRCRLRNDASNGDLLRATFPGGSITGAPKVRAMEIIDELEAHERGVYTGALGYVGAGAQLDLCIAIRTLQLCKGELRLWVGGGIVADSTPEAELEETAAKAKGLRAVLAD